MPEVKALKEGIQAANQLLYQKAAEDIYLSGMGTTLVAAFYAGDALYVANIGDSRLYLIGRGIRQITRDHSYVEEMVALGQMERNSRDYLQRKNIITRAVGVRNHVEADFFEEELLAGDLILMCSDGLTNMVEDSQIERILKEENDIRMAAERLVSQANVNGGQDNIAVILIDPEYRPIS